MAGSFKDLNIWQKGYDLLMRLYEITKKYPVEEKYGLTSQTLRSGNSIIANIAEAHGRYYFADKARILYQARGECTETQSHIEVAHGINYINDEECKELAAEYEILNKQISSYIKSLSNRKIN